MPHVIRLREPWEPIDGGFRRRFGRPTNLTTERVWLTCGNMTGLVRLNGEALGAAPGRFDVTDRLQPRNLLEVVGAVGDVALEIK